MGLNFTAEQVTKLFKMQDTLNTYIHPEWKTQDFDWLEAIIDECGEIKGHLGWKWWRPGYQQGVTEANKAQIKLEVIDILHFLVSGIVESGSTNPEQLVWNLTNSYLPYQYAVDNAVNDLRELAVQRYYPLVRWGWLAELLDMTAEEIMETYTQKYVLNKFRQDHGYKDGSYVKVWQTGWLGGVVGGVAKVQEDNEALTSIVTQLKAVGADTTDETALYKDLELRYHNRLNK